MYWPPAGLLSQWRRRPLKTHITWPRFLWSSDFEECVVWRGSYFRAMTKVTANRIAYQDLFVEISVCWQFCYTFRKIQSFRYKYRQYMTTLKVEKSKSNLEKIFLTVAMLLLLTKMWLVWSPSAGLLTAKAWSVLKLDLDISESDHWRIPGYT